ncbi:uncharacterized protein LOC110812798 [Carica papaya]|uniref:uncharacterized protein LOC110812798 n=1 Tax=Carica papaya TaxID=3649 RepID=UPI000B8CFF81|nr:uncharacterized protein LOC110812798 [Carica papaya]
MIICSSNIKELELEGGAMEWNLNSIRNLRAEERKAALRRIPEQYLLSEVRRMVEEMQTLNKKLEETEAAIDEYFKPVEKEAKILMEMQLQGEERTMKEMVAAMQEQALLEKSEAEKLASMKCADPNKK